MFDEQPDGDIHGECAAEIHRLQAALTDAVEAKDFMHRACLEAQDIAATANERMLSEYERAEAEGSRAVMLVRQRRRLQDDAKDALAHLTAAEAMTAHNTAISLSLCTAIRNAEVLVRGITQRLPNSPEADAGNGASEAPRSDEKAVHESGDALDARRYRWLRESNLLSYTSDTGPQPSTPESRMMWAINSAGKRTTDMIEIRLLCYHLGPHDEPIWKDGEHFDYGANMDAAIDAAMKGEPK